MPSELPSLSRVGALLAGDSPINLLMRDLAEALHERPQALFLGGGNPAQIPAVTETLAQALGKCLQDPAARTRGGILPVAVVGGPAGR